MGELRTNGACIICGKKITPGYHHVATGYADSLCAETRTPPKRCSRWEDQQHHFTDYAMETREMVKRCVCGAVVHMVAP